MVISFCFIGGWCYSCWWVWDLTTLAQLQGSAISPGLFQDFMGWYIKLCLGFPLPSPCQSSAPQFESQGEPIFDSAFVKLVYTISENIRFWDLSGGLWHGRPEFNYSSDRMVIWVSVLIFKLFMHIIAFIFQDYYHSISFLRSIPF